MAGVLLALFPLLLMFDTRAAWVALAVAIVLLCNKRLSAARPGRPPGAQNDASI
jgi:hypothetical protein